MKKANETLKQLLIQELPPGFVRALLERVDGIYPDTYEAVRNDPGLGEEQANYVLGYYRRGRVETELMRIAAEHGLSVQLVQPRNGGCKHIYVSAGRFGFTMCHVTSAGGFPKFSESREQSSQINECISQIDMFSIGEEPTDEEFYGVFVHTEQSHNKDKFKSLHIGFPNTDFDDWVEEPIDMRDILDIQTRLFQSQEDIHRELQNSDPSWKVDPATKEGSDK